MKKILIALQFWNGDKQPAMETARLIADLQTRHTDDADFLFVARFDTEQDMDTVRHVSRKFNTQHYVAKWHRGTGWPHGCNSLFFGTMDYFCSLQESAQSYKAILLMEADSTPLHPNWIRELSNGWDRAKTKMYGALINGDGPHPHINGNCMMSGDLEYLRWISRKVGGCTPQGGWDWVLWQDFKKRGWANAPEFRSWWRYTNMTPETFDELLNCNVSFLHGVKDASLRNLVRQRFVR